MNTVPDGSPPTGPPPHPATVPGEPLPGAAASPAPPGWWGPQRPTHPRATVSLVLGIVGLIGFVMVVPFVVSPLAWYYGAVARRDAQRDGHRWAPSGAATAGLVMGVIGTAVLVGGAVVMVGLAALGIVVVGTDTGYGG